MTLVDVNLYVMDRRHFVRFIGGVSLTSTLAPSYLFANKTLKANGVLVENLTGPMRRRIKCAVITGPVQVLVLT